ncbi:MAG: tetratricopeptide repeat protein [Marinilabiliaceae bacterium]|nr:tetratricopeptide repeat protein [Marinilabiliaceae bacterium]
MRSIELSAHECFRQGDYARAWELCTQVLKSTPGDVPAMALMGMLCHKAGRYAKAEQYLRDCLPLHPHPHMVMAELADVLMAQQRYSEADELLCRAASLNARFEKLWLRKAKLLKLQGDMSGAEMALRQLIQLDPRSAAAFNNLGNILVDDDRWAEAMLMYQKAVALNPQLGAAYKSIGLIELQSGNQRQAMEALVAAHRLMPADVSVLRGVGRLFEGRHLWDKANEVYAQIQTLEPDNHELLMLQGINHVRMGNVEQAAACFDTVWMRHPLYAEAFFRLARCKAELADWSYWDDTRSQLITLLERSLHTDGPFACAPIDLHYYHVPDELQYRVMHRLASQHVFRNRVAFDFSGRRHSRIRLGYLSPDFRAHALGMSVYKMFGCHDRSRFEVYLFSQHIPDENDPFHREIRQSADHFVDLRGMDAMASARIIHGHEIDILIDFGGYSMHAKPAILALKPAPVQVMMFGQPDTTAIPQVDYFVADDNLIDTDNRKYYSEKIIYLPQGFICSPIEPASTGLTRRQLGIPDDAFVFCSFCSPYKYEPTMFTLWMRLLKQVPGSVLWLMSNGSARYEQNIAAEAARHGVEAARILFAQPLPIHLHLERMQLADLFLDTRCYSSCSSGSHALMAGVPLVTLRGQSHASRQGATVCRAAGLHDTICYSMGQYYQKALELATHPRQLADLKARLDRRRHPIAHFDMPLNVRAIEQAWLTIWERYVAGNETADVVVGDG